MSDLMINSDSLDFGSTVNLMLKSESNLKYRRRDKKGCISMRFLLAFLSMLGCVMLYITRVNLSVTIVAMVNETSDQNNDNHTYNMLSCDENNSNNGINLTTINVKKCKSF
jgi:hypothetical protein